MKLLLGTIALAGIGLRVLPFVSMLHAPTADRDLVVVACAAIALALAALVPFLLMAALANESPEQRCIVLALAALDPLSIAALYGGSVAAGGAHGFAPGADAAIGGALCAATAFAVFWSRASAPRARAIGRGGCAIALLVAAVAAWRVAPVAADPVYLAWTDFGPAPLARLYAIVHHAGYALVPLAIGALWSASGKSLARLLVPALVAGLLVDRGTLARFSTLAVFAPILVALAAETVLDLHRRAITPAVGRLRAFGLVLVVLAVNAPVLASDVRSKGPRLPLHAFDANVRGPLLTTAPEAFGNAGAMPLQTGAELDARLRAPFDIVLPIVNGRLWRGDAAQLEAVERAALPRVEVRANRFDLYRFEVREYRR